MLYSFWAHLCTLHSGPKCVAVCLSVCLSVCHLSVWTGPKIIENNSYLGKYSGYLPVHAHPKSISSKVKCHSIGWSQGGLTSNVKLHFSWMLWSSMAFCKGFMVFDHQKFAVTISTMKYSEIPWVQINVMSFSEVSKITISSKCFKKHGDISWHLMIFRYFSWHNHVLSWHVMNLH